MGDEEVNWNARAHALVVRRWEDTRGNGIEGSLCRPMDSRQWVSLTVRVPRGAWWGAVRLCRGRGTNPLKRHHWLHYCKDTPLTETILAQT